jgi:hypothetical protein
LDLIAIYFLIDQLAIRNTASAAPSKIFLAVTGSRKYIGSQSANITPGWLSSGSITQARGICNNSEILTN